MSENRNQQNQADFFKQKISEYVYVKPDAAPAIRADQVPVKRKHLESCYLRGSFADSDCTSDVVPEGAVVERHLTLRPLCMCLTSEEHNYCVLLNFMAREEYFEAYFCLWKLESVGFINREDIPKTPILAEICYRVWFAHKAYFRMAELDQETIPELEVLPILKKHQQVISSLQSHHPEFPCLDLELFRSPHADVIAQNLKTSKAAAPFPPFMFTKNHHPQFTDYLFEMSTPETFLDLYHRTVNGASVQKFPLAFGSTWKMVVADNLSDSKADAPRMRVWMNSNKQGTTWMTTRAEVLLNCPFLQVLSLCCELKLLANWIPYYKRPFRIGVREVDDENYCKYGRCAKAACMTVDVPWPFKNRSMCMETTMINDLAHGRINFLQRSYDKEHQIPFMGAPAPELEDGCLPSSLFGCLTLKPFGPDNSQTLLQGLLDFDMKIRIPDTFISWFAGVFAKKALQEFNKECQKASVVGSATQAMRESDAWLFEFMEMKLKEHGLLSSKSPTE